MRFSKLNNTPITPKKSSWDIIGLMSGTSLDGLDIAFCQFSYAEGAWSYHVPAADCIPYPEEWRQRLQHAPVLNGLELLYLHQEYGQYLGEQVNSFIQHHRVQPQLIASHGHTIFHEPMRHISFQLGEGAAISAITKLPCVSDFRSLDVCAGGQGAPLVPIGDKLLFGDYLFCLNLGGIANISYDHEGKRIAYDISPCNLLLNRLAQKLGHEYDKDGAIARSGRVSEALLAQLNAWPYYAAKPPKSLDKEALLAELMPMIETSNVSIEDKIATVAEHIASQIGRAVHPATQGKMLITGGGAWNSFLVERIQYHTRLECLMPEAGLVNYKEALVFAFLGLLRVLNKPNCLFSVTGARFDNIGGALYGDFSVFLS